MSNLDPDPPETVCVGGTAPGPTHEMLLGRDVPLGKHTVVSRTLPHRDRRMVGAWHSEESPTDRPPTLHGVQLWIALPAAHAAVAPRFEHIDDLPRARVGRLDVTVLVGELAGSTSPAQVHSPLLGADVALAAGADAVVPLEPEFEHAVLVTAGQVEVDGEVVGTDCLLYLGTGRTGLALRATQDARALLLGGEPFEEEIVMWWNFVGRSHDDVEQARNDWQAGRRFGVVAGFDGDPLPAPELPAVRLRPRGRHRHA